LTGARFVREGVGGALMLVPRPVFEKRGGFDED
jgi:hypothetical protein